MSASVRITIAPTTIGDRGQRYCVRFDGRLLLTSTPCPELDGCRALLDQGVTGMLEVWREGAAAPAMRLDIERGARLAVKEGDRERLRFVRWRPFSEEQADRGSLVAEQPQKARSAA